MSERDELNVLSKYLGEIADARLEAKRREAQEAERQKEMDGVREYMINRLAKLSAETAPAPEPAAPPDNPHNLSDYEREICAGMRLSEETYAARKREIEARGGKVTDRR